MASEATRQKKNLVQRKANRTHLIPTGLLMEGVYTSLRRLFACWAKVNEFYKKGCQEKSSASTGGEICFLEIQPTVNLSG